jgi:hypothetical protein
MSLHQDLRHRDPLTVVVQVYSPLALIIPSEIAAPKLRTHTMSYAIIWVYLAEVIALGAAISLGIMSARGEYTA